MRICSKCGAQITDDADYCPRCNNRLETYENVKPLNHKPQTIEELKQWYVEHNLPPEETTRFFIGKNHPGPYAFGIYKNDITGEFIVYKNKSDGSRAIRYQGRDEAFAVNELYLKLKDEIANQKGVNRSGGRQVELMSRRAVTIIMVVICILPFLIGSIISLNTPDRGYYNYNDSYYYYQNGSWYNYGSNYWIKTTAPEELKKNYRNYYDSYSYSSSYGVGDFSDSIYYQEPSSSSSSSSSSSYDSSSSWSSSDSWDSGSTDWDSDW